MSIDINITRKGNIIVIIDQHHFSGKMTALSFVYLKMQISKIKETDLSQRFPQILNMLPRCSKFLRIQSGLGGQSFANVHIGLMQRILFPESVFSTGKNSI